MESKNEVRKGNLSFKGPDFKLNEPFPIRGNIIENFLDRKQVE